MGDPEAGDTRALLSILSEGYRPHQVVAVGEPGAEGAMVPILRHRIPVDGRATAYACVRMVCQPPVTESKELSRLLGNP